MSECDTHVGVRVGAMHAIIQQLQLHATARPLQSVFGAPRSRGEWWTDRGGAPRCLVSVRPCRFSPVLGPVSAPASSYKIIRSANCQNPQWELLSHLFTHHPILFEDKFTMSKDSENSISSDTEQSGIREEEDVGIDVVEEGTLNPVVGYEGEHTTGSSVEKGAAPKIRNQRWLIAVVTLLSFAIVGLVVGLAVGLSKNKGDDNNKSVSSVQNQNSNSTVVEETPDDNVENNQGDTGSDVVDTNDGSTNDVDNTGGNSTEATNDLTGDANDQGDQNATSVEDTQGDEGIEGSSTGTDEYIVDYNCNTDDDCAIKDVGNCCGTYYECANINFPADPTRACADGGGGDLLAGVCGWNVIHFCLCENGRCKGMQNQP